MKKFLLSMAVLAVGASAMAAETSYTIEFKTRADNNGANFTTETALADVASSGSDYLSAIASTDLCANGMYGLKVGQNKKNGSIELTLSDKGKVTPTKVELKVSANKNPAALEFQFNGTAYALESSNKNDTYATIEVNGYTAPISSLTFARANATSNTTEGFIYVKSVTVYYEADGQDPEISFPQLEYTAHLGQAFESPKATTVSDGAVTYTSSNEEAATVNAETGEITLVAVGTTTITATVAETSTYFSSYASYELTVVDPNALNPVWSWNKTTTGSIEPFTSILVGDNTFDPWTYDNRFGLKGSAYKSGSANETVAIAASPVIDLSNHKDLVLNFRQAANQYKDNGELIEVSEFPNYAIIVARVAGAEEWTEVAKATAPASFSWNFYDNEEIDLSAYNNKKIQFGFKYISTATMAGTWEIDNIVVSGKVGTGVAQITVDENVAPVYYNMQGVRVANPEKGLYIEVRGNKSRKVIF